MAYGFNNDKSKADVYTKNEMNSKLDSFKILSLVTPAISMVLDAKSSTTIAFDLPERVRANANFVGIVGIKPSESSNLIITSFWYQDGQMLFRVTNISDVRVGQSNYTISVQYAYCSANERLNDPSTI